MSRLDSLRRELAEVVKCLAILERKPRFLTESEQVIFRGLLERSRALACEIRELESLEHRALMDAQLVTGEDVA